MTDGKQYNIEQQTLRHEDSTWKKKTMTVSKKSSGESDYVFRSEVNAWLRLHMVPTIWSDAAMRCYLEGGILASPTTKAMTRAMSAMMAEHKLTRSVFTGINSILSTKNFKSLDGLSVSSIPVSWADGQPDNANTDEDCLVLTSEGKLADMSCESMLPYFCRKEDKCGATKAEGDSYSSN
ncbi:collectin-11-like [Cydia pomonella]|uniref:collectin-11-like n=1 Tax=Cydia pomonella TaxID=82600 RepID=UPI002ADD911F|nr:collectin-11-like [Cydia pomonella]